METNLILTANRWQLAPQLEQTKPFGGVLFIKNIPERTYLAVTPKQWEVLARFSQPRMVPEVMESIIDDRICPALGEFYELILKAVRARILVAPGRTVATVPAANWGLALNPTRLRVPIWVLFLTGFGFTVGLHPDLPSTFLAALAGLGALLLAAGLGAALSASLLRGAGGEVYIERGWLIRLHDVCMLPPSQQRTVALAPLAVFATTTGLLTWTRPEWSFFPLLGLLFLLRPVLHGRINHMIRARADKRLSDAEHAFLFPPNRTPRVRWRMLCAGIRNPTTWLEIGYGAVWTLVLGYFVGVLTDVPPWKVAFWQTQGPWLAVAIVGSLLLLGLLYAGSEFYLFASERAIARRETLRLWWRRWFGRPTQVPEESERLHAVQRSTLLRLLPPPDQQAVAKAMATHQAGPWRILHRLAAPVDKVSLILSGQVGVYRQLPTGRRVRVQVLGEDDLVGLHAVADPGNPGFIYRTLTPVILLQLDWALVESLVLPRLLPGALANHVQKAPFLARISLCQNWHRLAIQRFAELSRIKNYTRDEAILNEGFFSEDFFVMFEGGARIIRQGRLRGAVRGGDFFGEIGLLQNSSATSQVVANVGARSLCIRRKEFLRFVAHNYSVALELERVSSLRLGRPIFPLSPGNFRTI